MATGSSWGVGHGHLYRPLCAPELIAGPENNPDGPAAAANRHRGHDHVTAREPVMTRRLGHERFGARGGD
ncbi:hypothetical protein RKE32_36840 [Streptomyces sp. Li-HN-5-13]|nr:hypothetical protein RKE32_36840 [Streptomyces sp. Li-HN-5-13]